MATLCYILLSCLLMICLFHSKYGHVPHVHRGPPAARSRPEGAARGNVQKGRRAARREADGGTGMHEKDRICKNDRKRKSISAAIENYTESVASKCFRSQKFSRSTMQSVSGIVEPRELQCSCATDCVWFGRSALHCGILAA